MKRFLLFSLAKIQEVFEASSVFGCCFQEDNSSVIKQGKIVCMVFLRCMKPVVIQQRDQQLYVTSEPR